MLGIQKIFFRFWIFLLKFHRLSVRSPKLILSVTAALLLLAFLSLGQIRTLYAIHDLEDPTLSYATKFREMRTDFDLGSSMLIIFKPASKEYFTQSEIFNIRGWIANEDYSNSNLLRLGSPFDIRRPKISTDEMWYFRLIDKNLPEEVEGLKATPWKGILTSKQGQDLAVDLTFKSETQSQFYGSFDPRPVGEVLKNLAEKFKKVGAYFVTGEAAFQFFCHEGIQRNNELNFYLLIFLLLSFRFFFGTWRSGLSFVLTLIIMATLTFGTMSLFKIPIDLISSGLFLMLSVAALEDYLFICSEQLQRQTSWRKAMRSIVVPSFFTSLTTIFGFGSLVVTNMLIMKRFGIWAAFGSFVEWLACFIVLPALMAQFPYFRSLTNVSRAFRPELSVRFLNLKLNRLLARALMLIFALGFYGLFHLQISGAPKEMMASSHSFIRGLEELKSSRGWESLLHIVFEKNEPTNEQILNQIAKFENVSQILSPRMVEDFFTENLSKENKELAASELKDSEFFKSFYSKSHKARAVIYVKDTRTEVLMRLLRQITTLCRTNCFVTSEAAAQAEFSEQVPAEFIESFATSLVLLGFVLTLLVRLLSGSPRPYFSILISSLWGPFFIISLYWIFGTKIDFMACLFMCVLVGLAGDNAIQFLFAARKKSLNEGLMRRGTGSLVISLLIAGSCIIFLGSYFVSPRIYGVFLAIGIMVSTFGDIWLLRALQKKN